MPRIMHARVFGPVVVLLGLFLLGGPTNGMPQPKAPAAGPKLDLNTAPLEELQKLHPSHIVAMPGPSRTRHVRPCTLSASLGFWQDGRHGPVAATSSGVRPPKSRAATMSRNADAMPVDSRLPRL